MKRKKKEMNVNATKVKEIKQNEWKQYRIDLLNVPQQSSFPSKVTWPTKPE